MAQILENAPFEGISHHPQSPSLFQQHLPVQVQSCWNGIAVLDPVPFYSPPHVRFRMAKTLVENVAPANVICDEAGL